MGVLSSIVGRATETSSESIADDQELKYAILLNAGPDDTPTAANGMNYALEFDDNGYDVELFLDGRATQWPAEFAENPDRPFNEDWSRIQERGLLAGACGYCANAFDAAEACERADVSLLSDSGEHAPAVPQLAERGFEILTVG